MRWSNRWPTSVSARGWRRRARSDSDVERTRGPRANTLGERQINNWSAIALTQGSRLGHYDIHALVGAGGMGEVYRARDPRLARDVAIKVLPAHLTEDMSARERLRREALAAAALDHPFICKVYEIGESDGRLFIVMEFVDGLARTGDLRAFLASCDRASSGPMNLITALFHSWSAMTRFWLGHVDKGLADLTSTLGHTPPMGRAILDSQLFVASVIAGRVPEARQIMAQVTPSLPIAGRRNHASAWNTLETIVGLALLGETDPCGALYPAAKGWVDTGLILWSGLAMSGPQLVAGVAAHAAALPERAREHFETALRHAREVPLRLLQPSAQFWYGRMLLDDPESSERLRGRAMVQAAATDFRSLEMVTYADLAETLLQKTS